MKRNLVSDNIKPIILDEDIKPVLIDHNKAQISKIIEDAMSLNEGNSLLIRGNGDLESEAFVIDTYNEDIFMANDLILNNSSKHITKRERVRLRGKKVRHGFKNVK